MLFVFLPLFSNEASVKIKVIWLWSSDIFLCGIKHPLCSMWARWPDKKPSTQRRTRDAPYRSVVHLLVLLFLYCGNSRSGSGGCCGSSGGYGSGGSGLGEVSGRANAMRRHPKGAATVIGVTKNTGCKHKQAVIHADSHNLSFNTTGDHYWAYWKTDVTYFGTLCVSGADYACCYAK